jgi:hypothetical protein
MYRNVSQCIAMYRNVSQCITDLYISSSPGAEGFWGDFSRYTLVCVHGGGHLDYSCRTLYRYSTTLIMPFIRLLDPAQRTADFPLYHSLVIFRLHCTVYGFITAS